MWPHLSFLIFLTLELLKPNLNPHLPQKHKSQIHKTHLALQISNFDKLLLKVLFLLLLAFLLGDYWTHTLFGIGLKIHLLLLYFFALKDGLEKKINLVGRKSRKRNGLEILEI